MTQDAEYFSYVRHELRNQLVVIRESISQVLDGLGGHDCVKCMGLLRPSLECADKLNGLINTLLQEKALPKGAGEAKLQTDIVLEKFKKELITAIAHEIRTPLTVVKDGLAQLAEAKGSLAEDRQAQLLANVKECADRLSESVEKILEDSWRNIIKSLNEKYAGDREQGAFMGNKKVLVVDDEEQFLKVIRVRMKSLGYDVATASNGEEALEVIKTEKPAVVLLDIMMPGIDGLEVLRRIKEKDRFLPVFMVTAYSNEERFNEAKALGAAGFIVKTGDLGSAMERIKGVLNIAGRYKGE